MTPLLGVLFIPYRTSIIHPTLWNWTRKHLHRRLTCAEAERCRAGASLGGEHLSPLAQSAKDPPPQSLLSERRPDAAEPTKNRSGAVSGRSEPWRRTTSPLAHSAKDPPLQSLLSERRPDTAEPLQRQKQSRECPLLCK